MDAIAQLNHGDRLLSHGAAVGIQGATVVVGAPGKAATAHSESGVVYLYDLKNGQWVQTQLLSSPQAVDEEHFGEAVAIKTDAVIVGAPGAMGLESWRTGAAFVYRRSDNIWQTSVKLAAAEGTPSDEFGSTVSIDRDRAIVGAYGTSTELADHSGAAYVFFTHPGR